MGCSLKALDTRNTLHDILNTLSIGMMIFKTDGELLLCNHTADRIIENSSKMDIVDRQLQFRSRESAELNTRFHQALQQTSSDQGLILLGGQHAEDTLLLAFTPTNPPDQPVDTVVCMLVDPNSSPQIDPTLLKQLYGLTEAESEITALLAEGLNYSQIAEQRKVAVSTVRSYSKSIFRKLRVNCRSGVVLRVHATAIPVSNAASLNG